MSAPEQERFADDAHRYALESRIATGGMGEVWRGRDTILGRPVAVKLLKAEYADDARFRQRFEIEAQHAASLHHPGIAGVFDFGGSAPLDGSQTPLPYLVMELVEGQPLSDLLRPSAPMDPEVARDLLAQAAEALGAAHRAGIVHRDVKPGNLIVTPDRRVKVTDFGIARAAEGMALTETGQVLGTPAYISPEQAEGVQATSASDVYSLGVVAYECLVGRRPFVADTAVATAVAHLRQPVPEIPAHVPAPLAAVVTRALSKQPSERYADGSAFAVALRDPASAGAPASASAPAQTQVLPLTPAAGASAVGSTQVLHTPPPPGGSRRTNWIPWALLAAVLLVGGLIIAQLGTAADTNDQPADKPTPTQSSRNQTESPTPTTPSPTPTPTETAIEVVEGDYLGADVGDVESALRDLGLQVSTKQVDNPGDQIEDSVAGVSPSGRLLEGDTVTVSYWGKARGKDPDKGPDKPPKASSTETISPTTSPVTPTTSGRRR